jgi:flagellar basal body-associated protein FliL
MAEAAQDPKNQEPVFDGKGLPSPGGKGRQFILLCAGVMVIAAGAGYGAAVLGGYGGGPAPAPTPQAADAEPKPPAQEPYQYVDFDPITVNLDEPRLARYVCVVVTLEVTSTEFEEVKALVDTRKPALMNWMTVYFASCSLDDLRGSANLNRVQREILDGLNTRLWPDAKARIRNVLFKKLTVS